MQLKGQIHHTDILTKPYAICRDEKENCQEGNVTRCDFF